VFVAALVALLVLNVLSDADHVRALMKSGIGASSPAFVAVKRRRNSFGRIAAPWSATTTNAALVPDRLLRPGRNDVRAFEIG
jgi:hypothetical protein